MKFYIVIDATGHPAVMGEGRLQVAMDHSHELDVSDAYASYDQAMEAVADMRAARAANVPVAA